MPPTAPSSPRRQPEATFARSSALFGAPPDATGNTPRPMQQSVMRRNPTQQGDGFPFQQAADKQRPVAELRNIVGQFEHSDSLVATT